MSNFPSLSQRATLKPEEWGIEIMDAAIAHFKQKNNRKKRITDNFKNYTGHNINIIKKDIIEKYGGEPTTKVVSYGLGKAKIDLLRGEFLRIDIKQHVESSSPETMAEKAREYKKKRGAMALKPQLEQVAKSGLKPLGGAEIPSEDDPDLKRKLHPRTKNEIAMQAIIDDKIKRLHFKLKFLDAFMNAELTSEIHGKVYRNRNGEDDIMIIDPRKAIYQENEYDPLCLESPYDGDLKFLYPEEILMRYPDLKSEIKEHLKNLENGTNMDDYQNISYEEINGKRAYPVYYLQWWTVVEDFTKIVPDKNGGEPYYRDIDAKDYYANKKKYDYDVEKGKYSIEKKYREEIWHGVRICEEWHSNIEKMPDQINVLNSTSKYAAHTDYVHVLMNTVNGERISTQELMHPLSDLYDQVMFIIASEVRKVKGKVAVYDEAMKPGKRSMRKILYDMYEHGVLNVDSSQDGYDPISNQRALDFVKELDLGLSQSFPQLLQLKQDIELTIDKITGINEAREGGIKPTMTATGAMQNLEASRSVTQDVFFFMDLFINRCLTKVAEKTKLNDKWLKNNAVKLYGERTAAWLTMPDNLIDDDYVVTVSDGKRELELRQKMEQYFPLEINAGQLRSVDVWNFHQTKNYNEARMILEKGFEVMQQIRREEMQAQSKTAEQQMQTNLEMAREDREDKQAHEIEMQERQGEIDLAKISRKTRTDAPKALKIQN